MHFDAIMVKNRLFEFFQKEKVPAFAGRQVENKVCA